MSQQPPPEGPPPQPSSMPPPDDSPTVYQGPPPGSGYAPPPPPPPTTGYPPPPDSGYPPANTGYPPTPPGGGTPVYTPPPTPDDDNRTRNVVIGAVVALIVVLLLAAVYFFATRPPAPSFPVIIPTVAPSAEATETPKPTATEEPVQTEAAPTEEAPTEEPATEPPAEPTPTEAAGGPTEAPPTEVAPTQGTGTPLPLPSIIPGTEDHGVILGTPVLIGDPGSQQVALLVQNVDQTVKSYTLKATFKNGNTITATATGIVGDHFPGSIRTPVLYPDGTPGATDTVTVAVDTMFDEQPSTPNADIAQKVTFGPPTVMTDFIPSIVVEVTNGSDTTVSMGVTAGVLRNGVLVGVGTGLLSDFAGGETQTATLYVTGSVEETDQILLSVDSVLASE